MTALRNLILWPLLLAAGLLAGCASTWTLDNNVQSFSSLPAMPANPSYRFERLPSQQQAAGQAQLEALADPALFQAGFKRDDAKPVYSVQVSARIQRALSPWADPWDWGWGYGWAGPWHAPGFAFGWPPRRTEPSWFHREVAVVVREIASNKVVYETRAVNDGPWWDHDKVIAAMFHAALQGFPAAPPGPRRVDVTVGTS